MISEGVAIWLVCIFREGTRHQFGFRTLLAPVVLGPSQRSTTVRRFIPRSAIDSLGALGCFDLAHGIEGNFLQSLVEMAARVGCLFGLHAAGFMRL